MASDALHLVLLERAMASPRLPWPLAELLRRHATFARLGAVLVDLPYFEGFIGRALDDLRARPDRPCAWGDRFHREGAVALARALLDEATRLDDPGPLVAVALGHLTHVALDVATHPQINAKVDAELQLGLTHAGKLHRAIENAQAELWFRANVGRRLFGDPRSFGLLAQPAGRLGRGALGDAVARAMQTAFGEAPTAGQWRTWSFGMAQYALAVAGPVGLCFMHGRKLEAGQRWYAGFEATVDQATDAMIRDLGDAHDAFRTRRLSRSEFGARFPEQDLDFPELAPRLRLAR